MKETVQESFDKLIIMLLEDSESFKLTSENYVETYKVFIDYFETPPKITKKESASTIAKSFLGEGEFPKVVKLVHV